MYPIKKILRIVFEEKTPLSTPPVGGPEGPIFLDTHPPHLPSHRVLVHHVRVKFLARYLSLEIGDEVLDVFHSTPFAINALKKVGRWVVGWLGGCGWMGSHASWHAHRPFLPFGRSADVC